MKQNRWAAARAARAAKFKERMQDRIETLLAFLRAHRGTARPMEINEGCGWERGVSRRVCAEAAKRRFVTLTGKTDARRITLKSASMVHKDKVDRTPTPTPSNANGTGYIMIHLQSGEAKVFAKSSELLDAYATEVCRAGDKSVKIFRLGAQVHPKLNVRI